MTDLAELRSQILQTSATLGSIERALAAAPEAVPDDTVELTVNSLRKRQETLETQYLDEAAQLGLEVCSYRLFGADEEPKLAAMSRALDTFQSLVSAMYGVIKSGKPRTRGRLSEEVISQSAFDVGYAFAGSMGFVLTIPNKRLLIGESELDLAIQRIFEISQSKTPDDIAKHAQELGAAPIRAMYKWSNAHVEGGLGADIEWRRAQTVRAAVHLQVPELDQLRAAIEATGEPTEVHEELSGILVGIQAETRTFNLALDGGDHIRGSLSADFALDENETVRLPLRYTAALTKTTETNYATAQDKVSWTLDKLTPV